MKLILFITSFVFTLSLHAQLKSDSLTIETFTYDEKEELKMYCVRPSKYTPDKEYPAVVIFHGGGWSMGDASWGFSQAKHYAAMGLVAFSVQYRLQDLEEGITPYESVLDAQHAIRWIRENANQF